MKKKLIAGMTSAAVIASLSAPAFAANFGDVKGTNAESAAGLLKALGIVNGDVNGNFNPNTTITRAEFAKIAVRVAGLGAAADAYGTGAATGFNDVPAGHWAAGYVAVAKAAGLVKGYDQWNFGPNDNVRYEDVLTVVERILGYNDHLPGGYSAGYVVKGAALGLTKNTQFAVGKAATRGDVAVIAQAALNNDVVTYDKDLDYFYDSTKTLLDVKYSNSSVTAELTETASSVGTDLKDGEIRVGGVKYSTNSDTIIVGGSLAALVGHDVTVVADADGKASYVADVTVAGNVVAGDLTVDAGKTPVDVTTAVYTVKVGTTKYNVASDVAYYFNGAKVSSSFLNSNATDGDAVTLVLDKKTGDAQFIGVKHYEAPAVATADGVAATDLSDAVVAGSNATVYVDPTTVITRNGQPAKVTDIKKGDVLYWTKSTSADANGNIYATNLDVYSNTKTGTFQSYALKSDGVSLKSVTIDGVTYAVSGDFSIKTTDSGFPSFNTTVTVALDKDGNVATLATAASTAVSTTYFVEKAQTVNLLVDNQVVAYTQYTLLGSDGKVVTKYVAKQSDGTSDVAAAPVLVAGDVASLTFDASGYINGGSKRTTTVAAPLATNAVNQANKTVKVGTATYNVTATTLFVDESAALAATPDDFTKATGISFENIKDGQTVKVVVDPNNVGNVLAVIADTNTGISAQLAQQAGIYSSRYTTFDGTTTKYFVTLFVNGAKQTFETNGAVAAANVGDAVYLQDVDNGGNGDGKYDTLVTGTGSQTVAGTIAADNTITNGFTYNSGKYVYNNNTKVYIAKKDSTGAYTVYTSGAISDFTQYLSNPSSVPPLELTTTGTNFGGYTLVDSVVLYK